MIVGEVRAGREPVIAISVRGPTGTQRDLEAVIDTGFSDYLTLPVGVIRDLRLPFLEAIAYQLADAGEVTLDVYAGAVWWDGAWRDTLIAAADGGPLVGMALMEGCHIGIDAVEGGRVEVRALA